MKNKYSDLTIKDYKDLLDIYKLKESDYYKSGNFYDDNDINIDINYRIYAKLNDMDIEDVYNLPYIQILQNMNNLSFLNTLPNNPKIKFNNVITINNNKYLVTLKINELSAEDFIDFFTLSKKYTDPNNSIDYIHFILSLFIKPIDTEKKNIFGRTVYTFKEFDKRELAEELYNYLDWESAYSYMVFFSHLFNNLSNYTQRYLGKKMKKVLKMKKLTEEQKQIIISNLIGDGLKM